MSEQSFIVTLDRDDIMGPLMTSEVDDYIRAGIVDMGAACSTGLKSVRKYDPESEVFTSKIPAIKRIRSLLGCSLRDAKFLGDYAEREGSARWANVEVEYRPLGGFRVIDNI